MNRHDLFPDLCPGLFFCRIEGAEPPGTADGQSTVFTQMPDKVVFAFVVMRFDFLCGNHCCQREAQTQHQDKREDASEILHGQPP